MVLGREIEIQALIWIHSARSLMRYCNLNNRNAHKACGFGGGKQSCFLLVIRFRHYGCFARERRSFFKKKINKQKHIMPIVTKNNPEMLDFYYYAKEVWTDIPGYEGFYMASTEGRIKGVDRYVLSPLKNQSLRLVSGQILSLDTNIDGYRTIVLYKNGKHKRFRVNRLIATTYHANPLNKPEVNHINGVKHDDRAVNVEWVTKSENILHAIRIGLYGSVGEENHLAKMTEAQVITMRSEYAAGKTLGEIVAKHNTPYHATCNALQNKSWKYLLNK